MVPRKSELSSLEGEARVFLLSEDRGHQEVKDPIEKLHQKALVSLAEAGFLKKSSGGAAGAVLR